MSKRKEVYTGRPYEVLGALPDSAPVTIEEFQHWKGISPSKYWRDRKAGRVPPIHYVDQAMNSPRHLAGDMRQTYQNETEAA
mgnify:CR=1 FL=1